LIPKSNLNARSTPREGYAYEVVASNVGVCYHWLPSTANGNAFISSVKRRVEKIIAEDFYIIYW
jgi:hypothetical protein